MALKKEYKTAHGIVLNDAYIKIIDVSGNKHQLRLIVNIYVDQDNHDNGALEVASSVYHFTPIDTEEASRWDKQAYDYLKTLPEYQEAVDC